MITLRCLALAVVLTGACGPSAEVDPTVIGDGGGPSVERPLDAGPDQTQAGGSGVDSGGAGGSGGSGGGGTAGSGGGPADAAIDVMIASDVAIDLPPDQAAPDVAPPVDVMDVRSETAGPRVVLLVVANQGDLNTGDGLVRTALMNRGLMVRPLSASAMPNITGIDLVVITSSSPSADVAQKYRQVPVPVLVSEGALFDEMGMTGTMRATDYDVNAGTQVTITMAGHPMAAGLTGAVAVVSQSSDLIWGNPSAAAEKVATFGTMPNRLCLFGYPKGAMMAGLAAPARRIGFFASNEAAPRLTANGKKLLEAAIDWALLP